MKVKKGELCSTCGRYYSRYLATDGLLIKDNKVLLIKRKKGTRQGGNWSLPGGFLKWGETSEKAVLREVKEETGIKGRIISLLGVYSKPNRDEIENVTLAYLIKPLKQTPKIDKKEVVEISWFSPEDLPQNMAFDHRKIINDYLKKK